MSVATSLALALVRVPPDAARPSPEQFRRALDDDRRALGLPPGDPDNELIVTGPERVMIGAHRFDEYTVWER
ncbi:MAG TPA: hypothetical protein VMW17_03575 [Candidatus Binatia bacterium]|nr:hypothetical protein [Candidatus Binatia bacterium]